jgi:hypothetical protein
VSEIARDTTPMGRLKTHPIGDFPTGVVEVQIGEG